HWPGSGTLARQAVPHGPSGQVEFPRHGTVGQTSLVIGRSREEHGLARAVVPLQQSRLVTGDRLGERQAAHPFESAPPVVLKYRQQTALATADRQVLPAVAVEIQPRDSGAELAEFV